jgi:hypothetical protein
VLGYGGIVTLRRTDAAFDNATQLVEETRAISQALDRLGRSGRALLIDARRAPTSTDARMGKGFASMRDEIRRGFTRTAVLLNTKIGVLQANRLRAEDEPCQLEGIFDVEREAIAYLTKPER